MEAWVDPVSFQCGYSYAMGEFNAGGVRQPNISPGQPRPRLCKICAQRNAEKQRTKCSKCRRTPEQLETRANQARIRRANAIQHTEAKAALAARDSFLNEVADTMDQLVLAADLFQPEGVDLFYKDLADLAAADS